MVWLHPRVRERLKMRLEEMELDDDDWLGKTAADFEEEHGG